MFYGIVLRLPILALNLTQDDPNGQSNGPERREPLDAAAVLCKPNASGNRGQV